MVCVPVSVTYPFRSADCNAVSALAKDAIVVESKEIVPLDVIGHPVSPVPVATLVTPLAGASIAVQSDIVLVFPPLWI